MSPPHGTLPAAASQSPSRRQCRLCGLEHPTVTQRRDGAKDHTEPQSLSSSPHTFYWEILTVTGGGGGGVTTKVLMVVVVVRMVMVRMVVRVVRMKMVMV